MFKILCPVALLVLTACSSPLSGAEVDVALHQTLAAARGHHEAGRDPEAARLLLAVTEIDPDYEGLADLDDQVPTFVDLTYPGPLGINRRPRARTDSGIFTRIAWYLPDRVLDILDFFSFDVHIGVGVLANVHVTRAMQFGVGARTVGGVGWHDTRNLGVRTQAEAGFNLLAFGTQGVSAMQAGTSGVDGGSWSLAGFHGPSDDIYRDDRDYWAIGAAVTGGLAGVDFDIHPVEIFDGIVGFLMFDPLHDDFATTEGLDLSDTDKRFLRTVEKAASDEESLHNYRLFKGYEKPAPTAEAPAAEPPAAELPADDAADA